MTDKPMSAGVEPFPVGSTEWWTVRRVANGDATRPWYELTDEDIANLDQWREALEQNQLFRHPEEDPLAYQRALAKARVESEMASEPSIIAAAGRIFDWLSGGYAWRQRQSSNPTFYESADWQAAMNYARAALDPEHHQRQFDAWDKPSGEEKANG